MAVGMGRRPICTGSPTSAEAAVRCGHMASWSQLTSHAGVPQGEIPMVADALSVRGRIGSL